MSGEASAAEYGKELGDEAERELRKLWKHLILLYHPDRHAGEADTIDTYVKLMSTINRAKEERDIDRLREIYNDPGGFVLRQGWTWLDFSDADEVALLTKLLGTLYAEVVNKLRALNGLHGSPLYELHQLSNGRSGLFDEAAAGIAEAVSAEITQLAAEAEKLESEIFGATKPQFVNSNRERGALVTGGRGLNSLFRRDQADRIVINRGVRVLGALPRHEDIARALGM